MATLLDIMVDAGRLAHKVTSGTVGAASTTRYLVDPSLRDAGVDEGQHAGAWVYIPTATAGNEQRQLTERPFILDPGALEVTRPWGAAPVAAAAYYLFTPWPAMPHPAYPDCWRDAVNRGLADIEYEDHIQLTVVSGQPARFTVGAVTGWVPQRSHVSRVFARSAGTPYYEQDLIRSGSYYDVTSDEGVIVVALAAAPMAGVTIWADVIRPYAPLTTYSEATAAPQQAAAYAAAWQFLVLSGAPLGEAMDAWRKFNNRYERPPVRVRV